MAKLLKVYVRLFDSNLTSAVHKIDGIERPEIPDYPLWNFFVTARFDNNNESVIFIRRTKGFDRLEMINSEECEYRLNSDSNIEEYCKGLNVDGDIIWEDKRVGILQ